MDRSEPGPTCLYKENEAVVFDGHKVAQKMAEGWADHPAKWPPPKQVNESYRGDIQAPTPEPAPQPPEPAPQPIVEPTPAPQPAPEPEPTPSQPELTMGVAKPDATI